jgi:hypothetical protein
MRFSTSGFFHESVSPQPLSILLGLFQIFTKICGDIRNFVFIADVKDSDNKRFTVVNDTGENSSPVIKLSTYTLH